MGFLCLAGTACRDGAPIPQAAERTDSAGVSLVRILAEEEWPLPWRIDTVWATGGVADSIVSLARLNMSQVAADGPDRIYLLDGANHRVLVLGASGERRGVLGREGSGPDELITPVGLAVGSDRSVAVYDLGRDALVRWSHEGESLGLKRLTGVVWSGEFDLSGGGVVFLDQGMTEADVPIQRLTWEAAGGDRVLLTLEGLPSKPADFPSCALSGVLVPPLFSPGITWTARGERIAASTPPGYEIEEFVDGRVARRINWQRPLRRLTEDVVRASMPGGWFVAPLNCTVPTVEAVRGMGHAEFMPLVAALSYDPTGRLWVLRDRVGQDSGRIDVLGPDGAYLGTLPAGSPFPAAFLDEDSFIGFDLDSFDVPVVTKYVIRGR